MGVLYKTLERLPLPSLEVIFSPWPILALGTSALPSTPEAISMEAWI